MKKAIKNLTDGSLADRKFFCSWSGGKDSALAFDRAARAGAVPEVLLTMIVEDGSRTRAHGLPIEIIAQQAKSLGVRLVTCKASWDDYEDVFLSTIRQFRRDGIELGVFGDIDLAGHLEWVERVCSQAEITACEPLWKGNRRELLDEFFRLNYQATIVSVKRELLGDEFLGKILNEQTVSEIILAGVDASGEEGEYHTVVTDGPIFSSPVEIKPKGKIPHAGYCFLDLDATEG